MKYIYLKSIGLVEPTILENLVKSLDMLFPFQSKLIVDKENPLFAFEPNRDQYYAKKMIEKLAGELPLDCEKLV
ncbi:hypothetical protein KAT67_01880, partial [candidate division WOR-3 bacterium]|nr:hypothetical protein [candidate division WOR-3 bacterium]